MFQKLIRRFIQPRHHWRNIGFDELSELYTSMMFRSLAMSLVGIFVPVYLYQQGSPVWQVLLYFAVHFSAKLFSMPLVAYIIARIGPKHTMLVSYVFQMSSMIGFILLPHYDIPINIIALLSGPGAALFFTAFHVDFSKIKHTEHGGKEVGWMYSMQKAGAILGPIVGGVVALLFGSQYIFVAGLVLFILGAIPLLFTKEPVQTHQKLDFNSLKVEEIGRDLVSYGAFQAENVISALVWPLFIGVFIFKDNPYVQLGGVASISVIASLVMARAIGVMIDKRKGRNLLRFGAIANALLHLARPFSSGFLSILGINILNEGATVAYTMPYTKGIYDAADDHPGYRIVYITAMESVGAFSCVLLFSVAGMIAYFSSASEPLFFGLFAFAAVLSIIIMTERFRALDY